jgi:hypothetical protein
MPFIVQTSGITSMANAQSRDDTPSAVVLTAERLATFKKQTAYENGSGWRNVQ